MEPVESTVPKNGLRWLVVDWKTGAVPQGAHARAAAVQLAAYRLAWQRIVSTEAARSTTWPTTSQSHPSTSSTPTACGR